MGVRAVGRSSISRVQARARRMRSLHICSCGLRTMRRHSVGVDSATWRQDRQTWETERGKWESSSALRTNMWERSSVGSRWIKCR